MIATRQLVMGRGVWVVGRQNADIANTLHLKNVATATIFWLSIYGVHICATWRIRLNRPCAAAMRPYLKLLWPLVINVYIFAYFTAMITTTISTHTHKLIHSISKNSTHHQRWRTSKMSTNCCKIEWSHCCPEPLSKHLQQLMFNPNKRIIPPHSTKK